MSRSMGLVVLRLIGLLAACILFGSLSARANFSLANGFVIYRTPGYNYAPSVIQNGNIQYFWWCGYNQSLNADSIWYASINLNTQTFVTSPTIVLVPSSGTWDGANVCDSTVVQGSFNIPGIGSASYAMYYTGASNNGPAAQNAVGVAFSNNGFNWVKYSGNPVIKPSVWPTGNTYGAGQPSAYNSNGGSNVWVFYSDTTNGPNIFQQTSYDGVTFGGRTQIVGLPTSEAPNADFGYDYSTGTWYAAVPTGPNRIPPNRERWSITLFKTSNLSSGIWSQLGTIDTNLTGNYMNHSPGLLKDIYGNVTPFLPNIQVFYATGGTDGQPYNSWQLTWAVWNPSPSTLAFDRYYSPHYGDHWVTTGYYNSYYYYLEEILGYLFMAPQGTSTVPVYGCQIGNDHFVSLDPNCEGQYILGLNGYIYSGYQSGTHALYRCYTGTDHFVSTDPNCEGQRKEFLIGYAPTQNQ